MIQRQCCQKLREALIGVVCVANRQTKEFDAAREALAHPCAMPTEEEAGKAASKYAKNLAQSSASENHLRIGFLAGVRFAKGEK